MQSIIIQLKASHCIYIVLILLATPYQIVFVLEGIVQCGDPFLRPKHQDVPLLTKTGGLKH